MKHIQLTITGKVQGVFFRVSLRNVAAQLGVNGYVSNHADGSVYAEAEGSDDILKQLTDWCRRGPAGARVEQVTIREGTLKNFSKFEIRR